MRGLFVTFEGIEGSGKSTQIQLAVAALRGQDRIVTVSREPGGTIIADKIRALLLDPSNDAMSATTELLLYAASRAQHVAEVVRPALQRGDIVLVDRFSDSTRAYQGAARLLENEIVERACELATEGLEPELTIFIDVPVAVSQSRVRARERAADRLEQEGIDFHERVRDGFLALAMRHADRIKRIDGNREEKEIHQDVMELINNKIADFY